MLLLLFLRIIPLHNFSNDFFSWSAKLRPKKRTKRLFEVRILNEVFHTPGPAPTHSAIPEFVANAEQAVEIEADFNKMRLTMEEVSSQVTRLERAQENIGLMIRQELTKILPTIIAQSLSPTQNSSSLTSCIPGFGSTVHKKPGRSPRCTGYPRSQRG